MAASRNYGSTDSLKRTFVFIEIDGQTFDHWTDYQVGSDLLNGADTFTMSAPALPRDDEGRGEQLEDIDARAFRRGMTVKVYVKTPQAEKPVRILSGRLDDVELAESRDEGATVKVTGRSHMADIMDCDVLPSLGLENMTLAAAATKLLTTQFPGQPRPFFAPHELLVDNDANRILTTGKAAAGAKLSPNAPMNLEAFKVDQLKPQPDETIFQYLSRHATRFGLLIWGTADGKIVFGRPNYDQKPLYRLALRQGVAGVENTVVGFRQRVSFKHRPTEVHVFGRSKGGDQMKSSIRAVVYDDEVRDAGLWRVLTVHDNNARTKDQAEQRAKLELSKRRQTGDVVQAVTDGYSGADGAVYAIDTVADVHWDKAGIRDARYVVARTFTRSRYAGDQTLLELVPKGSIAIGGA